MQREKLQGEAGAATPGANAAVIMQRSRFRCKVRALPMLFNLARFLGMRVAIAPLNLP
jgi:hypothetical protein